MEKRKVSRITALSCRVVVKRLGFGIRLYGLMAFN